MTIIETSQTILLQVLFLSLCYCTITSAQTFDYVIVGGGPAGLTVANRLTENSSITVAVIEAGTFPEDVLGNVTQVPGYVGVLSSVPEVYDTNIEWGFFTTPQPSKNGTSVLYPRAKTWGGCTSINSMAYAHSAVGAYQLWANTVDDQSFTYHNLVPYYKKSMNFTPPDNETRFANATPSYHVSSTAEGGPLAVSYPSYATAFSTWVAKGMAALGIPQTFSAIDGTLSGSGYLLLTVNHPNGHRASAETQYLRPYLGRPNLFIFNGTLAERIIFNSEKVATGVEVTTDNTTYTISAAEEVIISAGVFQSPQLLMVSGIGPAALLEQYDIPVVADRPGVGQGMDDHLFVPVVYPVNLENIAVVTDEAIDEFNNEAIGPLTTTGSDYVGFERIPHALQANWSVETKKFFSSLPTDWPTSQYLILPEALAGTPEAGITYATIMPTLLAPQSRGNVSISSSSMSDPPLINPNWLATKADQEITIATVKRARQFMTSKAMSGVIIGEELSPGPSVQTDAQLLDYIRETFVYMSHAHSTNKMGNSSNPLAVVDTSGKVFGVKNLRVIDCSIFPFLLPGPAPQASVYMIAEKLADDIKSGK